MDKAEKHQHCGKDLPFCKLADFLEAKSEAREMDCDNCPNLNKCLRRWDGVSELSGRYALHRTGPYYKIFGELCKA